MDSSINILYFNKMSSLALHVSPVLLGVVLSNVKRVNNKKQQWYTNEMSIALGT